MEMNTTAAEGEGRKGKSFARLFPHIARVLMGLMFCVFGLNGFMNFIPQPPMPENIAAVNGALARAGYLPVAMGTQLLVGVLLLLNRFVPLALALIAPIIVGILTFHIFLAPATIVPGLVILVLELYLAWAYRKAYRPMLVMRVTPG